MEGEFLTDVAGQEIRVGDYVAYPQMSGRSVQMVLGKLIEIDDKGRAKVVRMEGSRWTASYTRTKWIDKRTGKGIDRSNRKHQERHAGYIKDGEYYTHEEMFDGTGGAYWQATEYGYRYTGPIYKDYVQEVPSEKPVLIGNVQNLVKVVYDDSSNDKE